jgi:ribonuclease D
MSSMSEQRPPHIEFGWIDSQDGLVELVDELLEMPRYALDTEFHR